MAGVAGVAPQAMLTGLHLIFINCPPPPCIVPLSIFFSTEIFVRVSTKSCRKEVAEDERSVDVYFEVVREESPGVYVPAEYTFDFNLTVTTVGGSATGKVLFGTCKSAKYYYHECKIRVKISHESFCHFNNIFYCRIP